MKRQKPETLVLERPESMEGNLKVIGGSMSDDWNHVVANQVVNALKMHADAQEWERHKVGAISSLVGINPKDELEGMLAAQLVASHNAAMECYRRAMLGQQTFEGRRENLSQASRLSRTHAALLEALNRHRGKGHQQRVTVEHVTVNQGGQAIVGNVTHPGGGSAPKSEGQPHAKSLAHAPQPEMPGDIEAEREAVPVAGGKGL